MSRPVCACTARAGWRSAWPPRSCELENCRACPRDCGFNRLQDETRACHTGRYAIVSSAFPHFGEEDCLRGWRGSGTIFFGLCNLRCVVLPELGHLAEARRARSATPREIAALMLDLQERGCHNINFVTPEHVAPQVIEAIAEAAPRGLRLPIVYNTSAYDALALAAPARRASSTSTCRTSSSGSRRRRCAWPGARDYPERAREAILEMHRQVGPLRFGPDGLARRGVLVRHLVMPGPGGRGRRDLRLAGPRGLARHLRQRDGPVPPGVPGRADRGQRNREARRHQPAPEARGDQAAYAAARRAGLWRFDHRGPHPLLRGN